MGMNKKNSQYNSLPIQNNAMPQRFHHLCYQAGSSWETEEEEDTHSSKVMFLFDGVHRKEMTKFSG